MTSGLVLAAIFRASALFEALALLENPDAEPEDADHVTALIIQTLKDTAP